MQYDNKISVVKDYFMFKPLSTRSRQTPQEKGNSSARYFKKITSDENQKNVMNYHEKFGTLRVNSSCKNIVSSVVTSCSKQDESKRALKPKKTNINMINISKPIKIFNAQSTITPNSESKESREPLPKSFKKDISHKNLKLTTSSSSEFPPILSKSISQTTMHRKMDETKMKLFDKIGMKKSSTKNMLANQDRLKIKEKEKSKKDKIKINQFQLGKKLGSGRFGSVYLAQEKDTNLLYAIKVMNKNKIKEADMEDQVFWQIKLQTYMNHPNILKLYGFFDDHKNIYLILEYCELCLFKDFRKKVKFSEQDTAYYAKQVVSALKYMHNESIIHRDIKPENIMVEFGVLKMADFGWSTYAPIYKRQTFCGTADYVPPQIVEGNTYDERVDIWALGVLMYELSSGYAPFETKDENITYDKIVNSQCKCPSHFSKDLRKIVLMILDKNPCNRPNLEQIEGEMWFEKYKGVGRYISKDIWSAYQKL